MKLAPALRTLLIAMALSLGEQTLGAQEEAPSVIGTWRGSYVCLQGKTSLTLTIDRQSGTSVSGYFHFYPPLLNPFAKEGCFSVRGEVDGTRHIRLDAARWITRPEGYVMVGLDGVVADAGVSLSGTVIAPPPIENGCAGFEVERVRSEAEIPALCQGPELLAMRPR